MWSRGRRRDEKNLCALFTQWPRPRVAAPLCSVGPRARRHCPYVRSQCFSVGTIEYPENFAVNSTIVARLPPKSLGKTGSRVMSYALFIIDAAALGLTVAAAVRRHLHHNRIAATMGTAAGMPVGSAVEALMGLTMASSQRRRAPRPTMHPGGTSEATAGTAAEATEDSGRPWRVKAGCAWLHALLIITVRVVECPPCSLPSPAAPFDNGIEGLEVPRAGNVAVRAALLITVEVCRTEAGNEAIRELPRIGIIPALHAQAAEGEKLP